MGEPAKRAETFLSDNGKPQFARRAETILPPQDVLDLRYFFDGWEGEALRANGGAESTDGGPTAYDAGQVRLVDSRGTARANRVRVRLARMMVSGQDAFVVALFRLYGPRAPGTPIADFRDLAPLADLTDAVDHARRELARKVGAERSATTLATATSANRASAADAEAMFWTAASEVEARRERTISDAAIPAAAVEAFWIAAGNVLRIDERLESDLDQDERERLLARRESRWATLERRMRAATPTLAGGATAARELAAWREVMRTAMAVVRDGGCDADRAAETASINADLEVTHADALRMRLEYRGKRDARGVPDAGAYGAWKGARNDFVSRVRGEAERLRVSASRAYVASRFA